MDIYSQGHISLQFIALSLLGIRKRIIKMQYIQTLIYLDEHNPYQSTKGPSTIKDELLF